MKHTTLCYLERDGKYLMLHRVKKKNDENREKWIGIGGKLEAGESPYDCARREIYEETGLTVDALQYRAFITFVSEEYGAEYMHLFSATDFHGEIKDTCDEGDLRWIDKKALYELTLWEGDRIFLGLLDTEPRFFSLKLIYDKEGRLLSHALDISSSSLPS
jgi:8-oxo-dGTP diphosphatase